MLEHAITIRDVLEWSAIAVGVIVVLGFGLWVLSLFADAFKD